MKLNFATNMPMEVSLTTLDGKAVESQFGGPQRQYTTTDGDTFYVSDTVGNIIAETCRKLKIEERQPIVICKADVADGRGRKVIRWQVGRPNLVGPQTDGTFALPTNRSGANGSHPSAPVAPASQPAPINGHNGTANGGDNGHGAPPSILPRPGWTLHLREQAQAMIDVYADCLTYSQRYVALDIAAEDVRSIVLSAFIDVSKNGGLR